jgi:cell wall-associated NlpC family hydrolase
MARVVVFLTLVTGLGGYGIQATQTTRTTQAAAVTEAAQAERDTQAAQTKRAGAVADGSSGYRASTDWLPGVATLTTRAAEHYVGSPYRWGGETPDGFDCSGFVQYVYALNGIPLPRLSRDQAQAGQPVEPALSELRKGDLVFFASAEAIDHVAIYAGDATIIHASLGRGAVGTDRLDRRDSWYAQRLVAARRVIDSPG